MASPQTGECPKCREQNSYTLSFCSFCGERLPWAPGSGTPVGPAPLNNSIAAHDRPSTLFFLASAFIPFCGLILYQSERDVAPLRAASARKGLLVGVGPQLLVFGLAALFFVNSRGPQTTRYSPSPTPFSQPSQAHSQVAQDFVQRLDKREAEKQAVELVDRQLKEQGSNLHCVQVVLRDSSTGNYTGEARLDNGTTLKVNLRAEIQPY